MHIYLLTKNLTPSMLTGNARPYSSRRALGLPVQLEATRQISLFNYYKLSTQTFHNITRIAKGHRLIKFVQLDCRLIIKGIVHTF